LAQTQLPALITYLGRADGKYEENLNENINYDYDISTLDVILNHVAEVAHWALTKIYHRSTW
jgi:hypothetical protein